MSINIFTTEDLAIAKSTVAISSAHHEDDSDDHNGGDDGAEDEELDNGDGDEISLVSKSFMIVYFLIDFATMEMTGGGMYVASSAKKGQGFCRIW